MEGKLSIECPHCNDTIALQVVKTELKKMKRVPLIEMVQSTTRKWRNDVDVIEDEKSVVVTPKAYLGKEVWYKINESLKPFDPEWVSAGKKSRWVIRERESQSNS